MDLRNRSTWIATFRRDQLADIVEGRGPTPKAGDAWCASKGIKTGYLLGIWIDEGRSLSHPLPQVVVAEQNVLQDLFAWSGTYLRSLGPLSALMRVVTTEQFEIQLNRKYSNNLWDLVGGMIGIIAAEIMIRGQIAIGTVASNHRPETALSYAIFRSVILGYPSVVLDDIVHNYLGLWGMFESGKIGAPIRNLPHVAMTLLGIERSEDKTRPLFVRSREWMDDLRSGASLVDIARQAIPYEDDDNNRRYVDRIEEMTAEERVRLFDSVAPRIIRDGVTGDPDDSAFALALGAFICRPGFEQQVLLMDDYRREVPDAMLWLGALQAFGSAADVLAMGGGFGWRVARDMFRTEGILETPRVDVAFSEIGSDRDRMSGAYRGLFERKHVDVELYPMVVAAFEKAQGGSERGMERSEAVDRESARRDEVLLGRLWHLERQLREAVSTTREFRERWGSRVEGTVRGKRRRRRYD